MITVRRAGATSRYWSYNGRGRRIRLFNDGEQICIAFAIPSKGGGTTELRVDIPPENYSELTKLMVVAEPHTAVKAFGRALTKGLPKA